ncbi:MAG: DNA translocase FtsK 4TM domain-containing protein [Planctomycetota bacterium]
MVNTQRPRDRRGRKESEVPPRSVPVTIILLGLGAVWLFVALCLMSFDPADAPSHAFWPRNTPPQNWMGPVGAAVAYGVTLVFGYAAWPAMALAATGIVAGAARGGISQPILRGTGALMTLAAIAGLAGVVGPGGGPLPALPGGTSGFVISAELVSRFGAAGAVLWLVVLLAIGLVVAFDRLVLVGAVRLAHAIANGTMRAGQGLAGWTQRLVGGAKPALAGFRFTDLDDDEPASRGSTGTKTPKAKKKTTKKQADIPEDAGGFAGTESFDPDAEDAETDEGEWEEGEWEYEDEAEEDAEAADWEEEWEDEDEALDPAAQADVDDADDEDGEAEGDEDEVGAPQVFDQDKLKEKIAKLPVRFASASKGSATEDDLADLQNGAELEGYRFPGVDLLEEPEEGFGEQLEEYVREQAEALESALQQYRIKGEVVGIESGPVITLYHVKLAPGTKVAALNAVSSDLARSLKSVNIRIVPNMAGRDTVGIEVPNAKKEKVRLKELMSDRSNFEGMKLPMFLGKDASGDPLIGDLAKMPHVLIAGTTGSGKSVCMNTIIMSFLYTKKPNELKLVLVDPKMVEMSQFKDIPHLMCPVVTEMAKAAAILEWAVGKMDERYALLAEAGVRDIASYNEMEWEELRDRFSPPGEELTPEEEAKIPRKLPYMVFIIDELADLMMTNKEVEGSIVRIAQKARAVGIHLILATQRPQANVVTGLIKGNMPCRISFKVASGLDSRIILDQKGGELLLGMGDMLFLSPSSHKLMRSQGTLVDDKEIRRVTRFLKEIAGPSFERQLVQLRSGGANSDEERLLQSQNNSSASLKAAQEDPMFDRAVEIVLETRRGSVSLLQRRLAIGYTRASRLIDLMGISGIIGEHKGSVAREVLITLEEWQEMKRLADEMAKAQGQEPVFSGARADGAKNADDPDQTFLFGEGEQEIASAAGDPEGVDAEASDDDSETETDEVDADDDQIDGEDPEDGTPYDEVSDEEEGEDAEEHAVDGDDPDDEEDWEWVEVDEEEDPKDALEEDEDDSETEEAPPFEPGTKRRTA